ncbi:MAG: hypothetical protein AAGI03_02060 [Pseudomonadota bacterium]
MVKGLARLRAQFGAVPEIVRSELVVSMERAANKLVREIRALIPRRSGALAATVGWTWGAVPRGSLVVARSSRGAGYGRIVLKIYVGNSDLVATGRGTLADLARWQEFGTRRMAANPYFYPVIRANRSNLRSSLRSAIARANRKLKTVK